MKQQIFTAVLDSVTGISQFLRAQIKTNINNLKEWRLAAPQQMIKQLNNEAAVSDERYRNIDKPFPLL
jgi:hypothetical protein